MTSVYYESAAGLYGPKLDEIPPETQGAGQRSEVRSWWDAGLEHFESGELEQAAQYFGKVLRYDPENRPALRNLGVIYNQLGRFKAAKETFERLVRVLESTEPKPAALASAHQGSGAALLCLWGQAGPQEPPSELASAAYREFSRVIELQPNNLGGWVGLGIALHIQDRLDEAEEAFRKALDIDPSNPLVTERLRGVLEDKLERRLFELGYLSKLNKPIRDFAPYENRQPIEAAGKPLSEIIIEERR
jgi:tetratricopeptide (TPR) repeat protein